MSAPPRFSATVLRKDPSLPRYVVLPNGAVDSWELTGTTVIEVSADGVALGRRSLKRWSPGADAWFFELTEDHCRRAGIDTGDTVRFELGRADETPPPEITGLLESDPAARARWNGLTAAARRSLSEHVRAGRRPTTRQRRARKGLGVDDGHS